MFKSIALLLVQFTSHYARVHVSRVPFFTELVYLTEKSVKTNSKQRIYTMTKKCTKKKLKESGVDSDVEIIYGTRIETRFEDTKAITGIAPEFKSMGLY